MRVLITYRLRAESVQAGLDALRTVYEELASIEPDWLSYATYQLADEVSFMSIVDVEDPSKLGELPEFQRYRASLDARCEQAPVVTDLTEIGTYEPS